MKHARRVATAVALIAIMSSSAMAQNKKELIQRILQLQQAEIESVTRSVIERPAAQMMQEAALAMQRQIATEKREAVGKQIEAEVKKYIDESYPLARERALKIAPQTIGAALEEKFNDEELRQLIAWLESPVQKKFQQMGPDMRNAFIRKLLQDAQPVVDPKVQALDNRIRVILGAPPAPSTPSPAPVAAPGARPQPARPAAPPPAASR